MTCTFDAESDIVLASKLDSCCDMLTFCSIDDVVREGLGIARSGFRFHQLWWQTGVILPDWPVHADWVSGVKARIEPLCQGCKMRWTDRR